MGEAAGGWRGWRGKVAGWMLDGWMVGWMDRWMDACAQSELLVPFGGRCCCAMLVAMLLAWGPNACVASRCLALLACRADSTCTLHD